MSLTAQTRKESFESFDAEAMQRKIWHWICERPEGLSPWQAYELLDRRHFIHAVRPRFNTLKDLGLIRVAGKRTGPTGKSEAYYTRAEPIQTVYEENGQGRLFA